MTLLIVDDDRPFREALSAAFTRRGYDVRTAASCDEARMVLETFTPERVTLDLRMPGESGLELIAELKRADPETAVVILTGYGSIPTAIEAVKRGAVDYLTKPVEPDQIEAAFEGRSSVAREDAAIAPSLDRVHWEHIQRVLADCGGNISEAARQLGMHRRTLQRKLQKLPSRR
ncbi:MAG: response regulator [Deltaproteobacteria bacterium]